MEATKLRRDIRASFERLEHKIIESEYRIVMKIGAITAIVVILNSITTIIAIKLF